MNRIVVSFLLGMVLVPACVRAENWAQWRGPNLNGSTSETNLPEVLDQSTMCWSTPLPGHGAGTPIIWGDRIFVSAEEKGSRKLWAICVNRADGKVLWSQEVGLGFGNAPGRMNDMASPSAVTDGRVAIFTFGTGDIVAFDFAGKTLWSRNLEKDFGKFNVLYLYGASPLLYKGMLYVPVLHRNVPISGGRGPNPGDKLAESYILAMDPASGKDIFRHIRPTDARSESQEAYCTPVAYEGKDRNELLVLGGNYLTGHDPQSGKELWRCGGWNTTDAMMRIVPSVTTADDLFIVCTPKARGHVFAVKTGGSGDITQTHVAWRNREIASDACSPLYYQGKLYILDGDFKKGLSCLDPKTGQRQWFTPLQSRPVFRTSPTGADGKIYVMNEAGDTWVISAGDGKVISKSALGSEGTARASIAVSQGQLFVRTGDKLLGFGKK